MRMFAVIGALTLAGCTTQAATQSELSAQWHAENVAAARAAGYQVLTDGNQTRFCSAKPPAGLVVASGCLAERDWSTAWRHALDVIAARDLGYRVISVAGQPRFCSPEPVMDSHMPACLSERDWEGQWPALYMARKSKRPDFTADLGNPR